jgi:hypothetical protein
MRRLLCGLATLLFLAEVAFAAQPVPLNDTQMDAVIAGEVFLFSLTATEITNSGTVMVNIDPVACTTCYLNIRNEAFTLQVQFGPIAGSSSFVFRNNGL